MVSTALIMAAVVALAIGTTGGALVINGTTSGMAVTNDSNAFDLNLKVVDSLSGHPIAGATVEVRDANNTLLASGVTDEDGEFGADNESAHDHEDQTNDSMEELQGDNEDRANDSLQEAQGDNNEGALNNEDQTNDSTQEVQTEDNDTLSAIPGPLTITVSMAGYATQTITVGIDTLNDNDLKVDLVPSG